MPAYSAYRSTVVPERLLLDHFGEAKNGVHRRAQLMTHVGEKLRARLSRRRRPARARSDSCLRRAHLLRPSASRSCSSRSSRVVRVHSATLRGDDGHEYRRQRRERAVERIGRGAVGPMKNTACTTRRGASAGMHRGDGNASRQRTGENQNQHHVVQHGRRRPQRRAHRAPGAEEQRDQRNEAAERRRNPATCAGA